MTTSQTKTGWRRAAVITTANTMPLGPRLGSWRSGLRRLQSRPPTATRAMTPIALLPDAPCPGVAVTGVETSALSVCYRSVFPALNRGVISRTLYVTSYADEIFTISSCKHTAATRWAVAFVLQNNSAALDKRDGNPLH